MIQETTHSGETTTVITWTGGFGHWLEDTRKHAGLTQKQLANKAKLSLPTIQRYEKGSLPSMRSYTRLMRALDRPVGGVSLSLSSKAFAEVKDEAE